MKMRNIDGVSSGGENDVKGLLTGAEHKKVGGGEKPGKARKW